MKRFVVCLTAALLLLGLAACGKTPAETTPTAPPETAPSEFMEGTTVNGLDVSGLTPDGAAATLRSIVESYALTLSLGETQQVLTAADLSLTFTGADFAALLQQQGVDGTLAFTPENLYTYDLSGLSETLTSLTASLTAENAKLLYDEQTGTFSLSGGTPGALDVTAALPQIEAAVQSLAPTCDVSSCRTAPEIAADSETATAALDTANRMLSTVLTYTYAPAGKDAATETLDKTRIAPWLIVGDDGLTVSLDEEAIGAYVSEMSEAHSVSNSTSRFKTTGGDYINVRVPTAGETVDTDALFTDIVACLKDGSSGERTAPYVKATGENSDVVAFGGTYVEVNLTKQALWYYKNGDLVVKCSIVSGNVSEGHATPTGVFKVRGKTAGTYLTGLDYKSWVDYWMPFNGGIGLHDATWRGSFGGTTYQYSGSHGCINMPHSAAKTMYANLTTGTTVVVYGGATSVAEREQTITCKDSFTAELGAEPFSLGASSLGSHTTLSYVSSNTSVATVAGKGVVTVKGIGTAIITITSKAGNGYPEISKQVTVNVTAMCAAGHTWDAGTVTKAATCTEKGVKTFTCQKCHETKTEEIPAAGHQYKNGVCSVCGAKDPNYTEPTTPPTTPTEPTTPPTESTEPTTPPTTPTESTAATAPSSEAGQS